MGKTELAGLLLVRTRQVDNHVANGMPVKRADGRTWFRWADVLPWYIDLKVASSRGRRPGEGGEDAKARREMAQARLAEIELAKAERTLVPVTEVVRQWGDMTQRIAGKLANVPSKFAARCVGLDTVGSAMKVLDEAVQEILGELHDTPPEGETDG